MCKIKEWEYDDAMSDYIKYTNKLEELLEENGDKEEIEELKKIISDYEELLF